MELEVGITFSRLVKSPAITLKGVSVRMPVTSGIQVCHIYLWGGVPRKTNENYLCQY